ncbi:hypothetical protein RBA63_22700 [Brenneria goodwinii]
MSGIFFNGYAEPPPLFLCDHSLPAAALIPGSTLTVPGEPFPALPKKSQINTLLYLMLFDGGQQKKSISERSMC